MNSYQIIVGSMLGGTEYVAEACEEDRNNLNYQTSSTPKTRLFIYPPRV